MWPLLQRMSPFMTRRGPEERCLIVGWPYSATYGKRPSCRFLMRATRKCSHIAVPALDGLADHRRRDLVGDLDVPDFAFALRGEVDEQLRDDRHVANLVAAQVEAARDFFECGPAEHSQAVVDAVGAQL